MNAEEDAKRVRGAGGRLNGLGSGVDVGMSWHTRAGGGREGPGRPVGNVDFGSPTEGGREVWVAAREVAGRRVSPSLSVVLCAFFPGAHVWPTCHGRDPS